MKQPSNQIKNPKSQAFFLIFLSWLVYTTSYLGKVNYSANITQIVDFYGVTKAQAGTVPTFFFFAYGIGQVFNGLFCKKYNIKWMIFFSLVVSATINLIIAVTSNFPMMKWLWMLNGFTMSILWPTLIRLLSEALPKKVLGTSTVVMGTTVAIGTSIIYGLSAIYVAFDRFKFSFYTAGIAIIAVAVIWLLFYNKAVKISKGERDNEAPEQNTETDTSAQEKQDSSSRKLLFTSIYVLCFCAIGVNLIKDGLTTWVPSILKDEFSMNDSLSILLTLFLLVLAVFGNIFALKLHQKIPDYVHHCVAVFAVIAIFIGIIIGSLACDWYLIMLIGMLIGLVVVSFLASSLNSLITSVFPLFMRGKVNSGLFAGILNGFCYLGSTISSYGLGAIADGFGWTAVFWTLIGFCGVSFVVWLGYVILKRRFSKDSL